MGIKDGLAERRMSVDEILADLDDERREILDRALTTRKNGASRFYEFSGERIVKELADDGYSITRREVDEWRREHGS